jgi:hypothetical protein
VIVQAWDFLPGQDWAHEMQQATTGAERLVVILSAAYLQSGHGEAEWRPFYAKDPSGARGSLLPVRVNAVEPTGLLKTRIVVDLVGLDANSARAALLAAARGVRGKPTSEPAFPGTRGRPISTEAEAPRFPGEPERAPAPDEETEAVPATRREVPSPGRRLALLVASWEYQDAALSQLRATGQDAEGLAQVLRDPEVGGFEVRTLLNPPAHEVQLAVEDLLADRGRDDLVLLYFSCHGVKHPNGRLYFATFTTRRDRLAATAVSSEFLEEQLDQSRSRRVLVLLDCCYSGALARGPTAKGDQRVDLTEPFQGRGRVVLTASSSTEYAFEGDQLTSHNPGPSVFTSALVEGLETGVADRDQDGRISADELYEYVVDQVRERTPYHTPTKAVWSVQGKLYVARNRRPVRPPELPAELTSALANPLPQVREGAIPALLGLVAGPDQAVAVLARQALHELTDDDSRRVSAAAANALAAIPTQPGVTGPRADAADHVDVQLTRDGTVHGWSWRWPDGSVERYRHTSRYQLTDDFGQVEVLVGRTTRAAWGRERGRIVVFGNTGGSASTFYPWTEFVETDDGDYAAKLPNPVDPRKGLRDGDALPPRFATSTVKRNDRLFRSIREGRTLRLVVKADQEPAMVSHAYWVARLRGHV